jgi:hypothetical protein
MSWRSEQSVIDVIDNKNRLLGKKLPPQREAYLMQFFWGAEAYSRTEEYGDCKLWIGISVVATVPFLLQSYPDGHTWRADGHTGLILFGANMSYQIALSNNARSSNLGSAYLRGRFYKYCDADTFLTRTQKEKMLDFFA